MASLEGKGKETGRQFATGRQTARLPKGIVRVGADKGWLRLRWTHQGKRYALTLGLPDSKINQAVAQQKAYQIELDIVSGNFDSTLKKYKTEATLKRSKISVVSLFCQFTEEKAKGVDRRTLAKYKATLSYLTEYFQSQSAEEVDIHTAEKFAVWLGHRNKGRVLKERIGLLKACWLWAQKKGMNVAVKNPWDEMVSRVKVVPKQPLKPFSREEIGAIILAFKSDRYYCYYADFVEFLFGTGCRTGEAIGLRWKHLSDDCSTVWIGESLSRGIRKSTKTNRSRTITLTPRLQAMLLSRKPADISPDELVFTTPSGKSIDDNNFRNRAWKTVLTRLEIPYRKPYATRSTLVRHALDLGHSPIMVAQLTGHDVKTLYSNYAGYVNSKPMLPEL